MLQLAVVFFVIALVAGALGFTGVAVGAALVAQLLFGLFLVLALGSFALDLLRRPRARCLRSRTARGRSCCRVARCVCSCRVTPR